jgi:predicted cobalt transporter CbtA
MSARTLLVRGMLVGILAGLLAYLFATLVGEAQIDRAIAFEAAHNPGGAGEPQPVSRAVQATLGLGIAVVVYGVALGGLFALAFALLYGRLGRLGARATAVLVAVLGFTSVCLAPFLKYPANPPAVGRGDTIGQRTTLYFLMLLISVLAAVTAVLAGRSLLARLDPWNATLAAIGVFLAIVIVAGVALPTVDEVPADFPATLLWRFRLASLGVQAVLWAALGLLFGALTERAARRAAPRPAPVG